MTLPLTPEPGRHMAEQTKSRNFFPHAVLGFGLKKEVGFPSHSAPFLAVGPSLSQRGSTGLCVYMVVSTRNAKVPISLFVLGGQYRCVTAQGHMLPK